MVKRVLGGAGGRREYKERCWRYLGLNLPFAAEPPTKNMNRFRRILLNKRQVLELLSWRIENTDKEQTYRKLKRLGVLLACQSLRLQISDVQSLLTAHGKFRLAQIDNVEKLWNLESIYTTKMALY
jgi:hypothetical protein